MDLARRRPALLRPANQRARHGKGIYELRDDRRMEAPARGRKLGCFRMGDSRINREARCGRRSGPARRDRSADSRSRFCR